MADAYWRYGDGRQPPPREIPPVAKRPRSDYDAPGGHDRSSYHPHDDERGTLRAGRDSDSIGASYDRYLRNTQVLSYIGEPGRPVTGGVTSQPIADPRAMGKDQGFGGRRELSLPRDASSTLFVEGLPANCTRREVSRYKEVRLVSKDARRSGRDPLVLCFVDFVSPAHAATAMDALQGYKFDEHDRDSISLRLQFSRSPGARSGVRNCGRR